MTSRQSRRVRVHLFAVTLLLAFTALVHAQSIVGTWQGTLPDGPFQRIVFKFSTAADNSLHGTFTPIDRGATGIPIITVSYTAPNLTVEIADIRYTGKLSADGNSITGTWSRTGATSPLTLARATADTLWTYSGPAALPPMAANADPSFEVATIKPSKPGAPGGVQFNLRARQFTAANVSAKELIKIAYNVRGRQVDGGPSWIEDTKFDIVADPDTPGLPSEQQVRTMVRKLVEDRFGLKAHLSLRDFPIYALVVDKVTNKLTPSDTSQNGHMSIYTKPEKEGEIAAQFAYCTMADLASLMMNFIQSHQIVDETGLMGQFDFAINIPTTALQSSPSAVDDPDPAFEHAVQPLGLKFVLKKEPLQVVVIDHLDPPSPN